MTTKPAGGWWNWKDEKTALECLFILGELMIARRRSFQRLYDLRERVLPGWRWRSVENVPSKDEVLRTLTLRAVQALGVAHASWCPITTACPRRNLGRLEALVDEGLLHR